MQEEERSGKLATGASASLWARNDIRDNFREERECMSRTMLKYKEERNDFVFHKASLFERRIRCTAM